MKTRNQSCTRRPVTFNAVRPDVKRKAFRVRPEYHYKKHQWVPFGVGDDKYDEA